MDIYNNFNVAGDVKANKINLSDRVVVSVDGITNGGLQYCFPACSGTIATQSYVDEKTCGIVIDAYTKAEVDEKVNCLEGSIASVEADVSNKASQFSLTCHEAKVGGASQAGHVKVASSFGSAETCVVPSLSLVCSTFGGYVTTTCLNAYKNTTTCNFNFIAGCIEGVRCYVADVESDLTTAKQNIQQNASDIAALQASSGCLENVYTKTQVDELLNNKANSADIPDISGKADKATTLSGYCISDAYTKTETDELLCSKASQSTTLSGYGITNAYTKTEVDDIVSSIGGSSGFCSQNNSYCVENLVFSATDTSTYLAGQEIHFGDTQCLNNAILTVSGRIRTSSLISNLVSSFQIEVCSICTYYRPKLSSQESIITWDDICSRGLVTKSDVSCYVESKLSISDTYTKTEVDDLLANKANSSEIPDVNGKADKATTLAGYGIENAYTKADVDGLLNNKANSTDIPDISGKADKATTLDGYGIKNAYTKSEVDGIVSSLEVSDGFCSKNTEYPVENLAFRFAGTSSYLVDQAVFIGCTASSNNAVLVVNGCIRSNSGLSADRLESCSLDVYHRPRVTSNYYDSTTWDCIYCNALVTKNDVSCYVAGLELSGCKDGFCGIDITYIAKNLHFRTETTTPYLVTIGGDNTALSINGPSYFDRRPTSGTEETSWEGIDNNLLVTKKDVGCYLDRFCSGLSYTKFNSIEARYCACNLVFTTAFSPYCTVTIGCSRNSTALTVCGKSFFSCRPESCNAEVWDAICSSSLITKKDVASYVESKLSGASSSNICGLSASAYQSLVSSGSVKANTLYVIV